MLTSFATILAGLGLFFAGLSFLTENLKKLEGQRLSDALVTGIGKPRRAFVCGLVVGGLTHTATITVFVLTGLLAAGLTTLKASLPVLLGVNIGTSALVFLAVLDVDTIVLILTGATGMAIASEKAAALRTVIKAVFGVSLLFVGIIMIQDGSSSIVEQAWIQQYLSENHESFLIAFCAGVVLRVIAQSASAVTIFAISLTSTGAFGIEQTIMAIYGANFGAALSTWILSAGVRGHSRQIANYQVLFDALGTLVLVPLFYIELRSGLPLMRSLVTLITENVQQQMAFVFLFFNIIAALSLVTMLSLSNLATRWWRQTRSHLPPRKSRLKRNSRLKNTHSNLDERQLPTHYAIILEDAIGELLRQADAYLDTHRFTSPPENNAWERYKAVLILDPDNFQARRGLNTLIERYVELAGSAQADNRLGDAEYYMGKARAILFELSEDSPGPCNETFTAVYT